MPAAQGVYHIASSPAPLFGPWRPVSSPYRSIATVASPLTTPPVSPLRRAHVQLTRFNLALECGNLDIALKAAKAVNSEEAWARLASEALRQGNLEIVELAYQVRACVRACGWLGGRRNVSLSQVSQLPQCGRSDRMRVLCVLRALCARAHAARLPPRLSTRTTTPRVSVVAV